MDEGVRLRITQEKGFLRIGLIGRFPQDLLEFYTRVTTTMKLSGHMRFLFDVRELVDWPDPQATHDFVTRYYPEPSGHRTAILALPEQLGFCRFYETMIQNRGYDTRLFKDEEEASAWLRS